MTTIPNAKVAGTKQKRRGVVIVAVLIVVVLLSLAGYQYSDLMLAEYKAAENSHRVAQARSFSDSGIHYALALMGNSDNVTNTLGGNFWNNPAYFQDIALHGDNGVSGRFSLIAPPDPDGSGSDPTTPNFGVTDESSKINLNAVMAIDPSGKTLYNMLMLLPNMTDPIANSIIDWMDPDGAVRSSGAESDYYQGLNPPYQAKNAAPDSIDELLLVQGVTWPLLYGCDYNRNGYQDSDETSGVTTGTTTYSNGFDRGWSAYLTVHSRESTTDGKGSPLINLNNTDLTSLFPLLSEATSNDLATFIILYRQNGASTSGSTSSSGGTSGSSGSGVLGAAASAMTKVMTSTKTQTATNTTTVQGTLSSVQLDLTKAGKTQINSIWSLVNSQVSVTSGKTTTVYKSPLSDASGNLPVLLPQIFTGTTLVQGTDIPARINVNTAPSAVLATIPGLSQNDVQNILNTRPSLSSSEPANPAFQTPAWLYTQARMSLSTLAKLDKYITTRSQVFRVQSVGYFDGNGPSSRVEAIIDANSGRPRILAWRNLSELGKGYTSSPSTSSGKSSNP